MEWQCRLQQGLLGTSSGNGLATAHQYLSARSLSPFLHQSPRWVMKVSWLKFHSQRAAHICRR